MKRPEPDRHAVAVAADAGGLKNDLVRPARDPAWRAIDRVALGGFAESGTIHRHHADIPNAIAVFHRASEARLRGIAVQIDPPPLGAMKKPLFLGPEIAKQKNAGEIIGVEGV